MTNQEFIDGLSIATREQIDIATQSGLSSSLTAAWRQQDAQYDKDYKGFKAFYNGVVSPVRGAFGVGEAINDLTIQNKEVNDLLKSGYNSQALQDYNVRGDSALGQFGLDIMRNLPQFMVSAFVRSPVAGVAMMTADILGNQYHDLKSKGISTERAAIAAFTNATIQNILERIGVSTITKKIPWSSAAGTIAKAAGEEAGTEFLQQIYGDQLTQLYGEKEGRTVYDTLNLWINNWKQNISEATYAGLLGAIMGAGGGTAKAMLDRQVAKQNTEVKEKITQAMSDRLGKVCENDVKSGVNADFVKADAATTAANAGVDTTVFIDAKALDGYAQTVTDEQVFKDLGTTPERIAEAAKNGESIEATIPQVRAANITSKGILYKAIQDNIAFNVGDISVSTSKYLRSMQDSYTLAETEQLKLEDELDKITKSANDAGVSKDFLKQYRTLLMSRAMVADPEHPAEFLKRHPLEFKKGGDGENQNGKFTPGSISENKINVINLFDGNDVSTVLHETGHYFFETMFEEVQSSIADGSIKDNPQLAQDFDTLLNYAGTNREAFAKMSVKDRSATHEHIAEAFESYLMTGKAPSSALRRAFNRFKQWLLSIYKERKRSANALPLTPEVQGVFDRMLATEEEVDLMINTEGYLAKLPKELLDKLTPGSMIKLQDAIAKARDKAVEKVTKETMKNYSAERQNKIAEYRKEVTPEATKEVEDNEFYQSLDYLMTVIPEATGDTGSEVKKPEVRTPKGLAQRYLIEGTNEYADWKAELNAVQKQLDAEMGDTIEYLKGGFGHGVGKIILEELEGGIQEYEWNHIQEYEEKKTKNGKGRSPYVYHYLYLSNNAKWYSEFYNQVGRPPNAAELEALAYYLLTDDNGRDGIVKYDESGLFAETEDDPDSIAKLIGSDIYDYRFRRMDVQNWEVDNFTPPFELPREEYLKNREILRPLLRRKYELLAKKESIKTAQKVGLRTESKVEFDVVAEMLGTTGQEYAKRIIASPTKEQMIKQLVDERVQKAFPEFWKDRAAVESTVREALYNDATAEVLAAEEQIIYDSLTKIGEQQKNIQIRAEEKKARVQRAKLEAMDIINSKTIRELQRVTKFIAEERSAAVNAAIAAKENKGEEALEFKHQELVMHEVVRRVLAIREELDSSTRYLAKMAGLKQERWANHITWDAAADLFRLLGYKLKGYDFAQHPDMDRTTFADFVRNVQGTFGEDFFPVNMELLASGADLTNPKALTYEQFKDCVNAVKSLRCIDRMYAKDNKEGLAAWLDNLRKEILEHLSNLKTVWMPQGTNGDKPTFLGKFMSTFATSDTLFEYLDGFGKYGYFVRTWLHWLSECADKESTMQKWFRGQISDATKKYQEALRAIGHEVDENISIPELGNGLDGKPLVLSRNKLVAILLNLGNPEGRNRICATRPVFVGESNVWVTADSVTKIAKQQAIKETEQNLVRILGQYLTEADVDYAQSVIDACNSFYDDLKQVDIETTGFYAPKVEACPQVLTYADGMTRVFQGGYFPLRRDVSLGSHPGSSQAVPGTDNTVKDIGTLYTNSAASKARFANVEYPVNLNPDSFMQPIFNTIHDICYRHTMRDFQMLLNDGDIYAALKSKLGIAGMNNLKEVLVTAAHPYDSAQMQAAEATIGSALNWLRRRTVNAAIYTKLPTTLQNFGNTLLFGGAVEGWTQKDAFNAVLSAWSNKTRLAECFELIKKSAYMMERMEIPDITVRDIIDGNQQNKFEEVIQKFGTKMLWWTDGFSAVPNWAGAYNKAIHEFGADEHEAILYADDLVRRVLGSSRAQDVASIQRGSPTFKLLTMFQGFFITQANQWIREIGQDTQLWSEGQKLDAAGNMASFLTAKYFVTCLLSVVLALRNPFDKDKEDDVMNEWMKECANYPLSMLGPIGQSANMLLNNLFGIRTYGYRMTAIQSTIDRFGKAARTINRFVNDDADAKDLAESLSYSLGLIAGVPDQLNTILWNAYDVVVNGMTPMLGDLARRRPKSER